LKPEECQRPVIPVGDICMNFGGSEHTEIVKIIKDMTSTSNGLKLITMNT
jgi:hypothetical protein